MVEINKNPEPKRKRPATPEQIRANRENSKKSTGPRSPEGKAASSRNALKLGLTCTTFTFLPGESEAAFDHDVDTWARSLRVETPDELHQVKLAIYSAVVVGRCSHAEASACREALDTADVVAFQAQSREVAELWQLLPTQPAVAMSGLRERSQGLKLVLSHVKCLIQQLKETLSLYPDQRVHALHLMGRRPQDLFNDPHVRKFTVDYLSALKGHGGLTEAEAARLLVREQPEMPRDEFECRLGELLLELVPEEEGNAYLKQMLRTLQNELELHLADVEQREARQRQYRRLKAEVDTSREGQNVARYSSAAQRQHHAALRQLRALQAERRAHGEGALEQPLQPSPSDAGKVPSEGTSEAPEAEMKNEADSPQTVELSMVGDGPFRPGAMSKAVPSGPVAADPVKPQGSSPQHRLSPPLLE